MGNNHVGKKGIIIPPKVNTFLHKNASVFTFLRKYPGSLKVKKSFHFWH